MATFDFATLNEEWIVRYDQSLQRLTEAEINYNDSSTVEYLVGTTIAARAGRLGALTCASLEEPGTAIDEYLNHTQRELDRHAASKKQIQLLECLCPTLPCTSDENQSSILDVDVDAFFDEYPECMRSDWGKLKNEEDDEEEDDEESDIDDCENERPAKKPPSGGHAPKSVLGDSAGPFTLCERFYQSSATSIDQEQNPFQESRKPTSYEANTRSRNPYSQPLEKNQFSYTPASQPPPNHPSAASSSSSSWDNNNSTHASSKPYTSSYTFQRDMARSSNQAISRPASSNNHSAWEDHCKQQNPFQTAREFAQAGGDNNNEETSKRNQPIIRSRGPEGHGNPYLRQTLPVDKSNPVGGHSIPESLKRKFQVPKRTEVRGVWKHASKAMLRSNFVCLEEFSYLWCSH